MKKHYLSTKPEFDLKFDQKILKIMYPFWAIFLKKSNNLFDICVKNIFTYVSIYIFNHIENQQKTTSIIISSSISSNIVTLIVLGCVKDKYRLLTTSRHGNYIHSFSIQWLHRCLKHIFNYIQWYSCEIPIQETSQQVH